MGTTYFIACHECREWCDLDKFHSFGTLSLDATPAQISRWLARGPHPTVDDLRRGRMEGFLRAHPAHRIEVASEHDDAFMQTRDYREVAPWPRFPPDEPELEAFANGGEIPDALRPLLAIEKQEAE